MSNLVDGDIVRTQIHISEIPFELIDLLMKSAYM